MTSSKSHLLNAIDDSNNTSIEAMQNLMLINELKRANTKTDEITQYAMQKSLVCAELEKQVATLKQKIHELENKLETRDMAVSQMFGFDLSKIVNEKAPMMRSSSHIELYKDMYRDRVILDIMKLTPEMVDKYRNKERSQLVLISAQHGKEKAIQDISKLQWLIK